MGTSVDHGKERAKDTTSGAQFVALPFLKPSSTDVPVLLLNQPFVLGEGMSELTT